ncbi:DNA cytosine methyltransferase [Herbiconiux liangxiaofengii]|uniref:DNA cytosine methyltransferase n=1 Tax=Herbiconiux liangxiaofengii TaxID=3342795 RepID=UPI0035B8B81A
MTHTPSEVASLRRTDRPDFASGASKVQVVDLFAGCGGLTLGVGQAAKAAGRGLDVRLALDFEKAATDVYGANFEDAHVVTDSVEAYFDGKLGAEVTVAEAETLRLVGSTDFLLGGPPCQGHSNLNNKTRRNDPKNELYARMARAAEVLNPKFVLIENVPSVRYDTAGVVQTTVDHLRLIGYKVEAATISFHALGVAQKRKRHVLLASRITAVDPKAVLDALVAKVPDGTHNLEWAIKDLENLASRKGYDVEPVASETNKKRMQYLLDKKLYDLPNSERPDCHQNDHSYKSMYGRLKWTEPAQTITSGFGSIGQGRYMHPTQRRALTAHEAARIQGFPDYFDFSVVTKRANLSTMIGNAVPPALMREIATALIPSIEVSEATGPAPDEISMPIPASELLLVG